VVGAFKRRYPRVHLTIKQGNPPQLAEMVIAREADMAIATEALDTIQAPRAAGLRMRHCVVCGEAPAREEQRLTLEMLARYPVVTYDPRSPGGAASTRRFRRRAHPGHRAFSGRLDVIKTYVELGLGVGVIAAMAFDEKRDRHLRALEAGHLFAP